ncbi:MAG: radical SAM protein [Bacteroidales bacterium]|nr:radical SAM protein [Bacteroidales bacterium]MCB8999951.1 radical SAM protein [Bacteroidales bacterium]MCB9012598.1 radical SAM protein [Bacteroidales bacterium]
MYDAFNRNINYLRISVTDRCNLRCTYCMPEEGIPLLRHKNILSFEEITDFVRTAVSTGITKVRLTGGEPLVRKGIVELVEMLGQIPGIEDLSMTTNGILLKKYAHDLKKAGLMRVNISLDTLDPERFREITRLGDVQDVLGGIEAALDAGLKPVKLNCVIKKNRLEPDALLVARYAEDKNIQVRYIREMDLDNGIFYEVDGGEGGKCNTCNRLRLTANGDLNPCLFDKASYNIREMGALNALSEAVKNKPACGTLNRKGKFYNIGG